MAKTVDRILAELAQIAPRIDEAELQRLADLIIEADRVYLAGMGRSGLMARAFAMRLMHLGTTVFVVGETTTPSIEEDDLLVCCTRFGRSGSLLHYIQKARAAGAAVAVVTTDPAAPMVDKADHTLLVPLGDDERTQQPLGTLFEQQLLITLDALVMVLMEKKHFTEREMALRHNILE